MNRLRTRGRALVAAGVTTLLLTTAGPALADREIITDPSRDALLTHSITPNKTQLDPTMKSIDIRRTRINHGKEKVRVRIDVRDLRRSDHFVNYALDLKSRSADGHTDAFRVVLEKGRGRNAKVTFDVITERSGLSSKCSATDYRVRPFVNRVEFSVARSCLGNPSWVRGRVTATATAGHFDGISDVGHMDTWIDDARRAKRVGSGYGPRLISGHYIF